jgi:hypothetical protein
MKSTTPREKHPRYATSVRVNADSIAVEYKANAVCGDTLKRADGAHQVIDSTGGDSEMAPVAVYFRGGIAARANSYGDLATEAIIDQKQDTVRASLYEFSIVTEPPFVEIPRAEDAADREAPPYFELSKTGFRTSTAFKTGFCATLFFATQVGGFAAIPQVRGKIVALIYHPVEIVALDSLRARLAKGSIVKLTVHRLHGARVELKVGNWVKYNSLDVQLPLDIDVHFYADGEEKTPVSSPHENMYRYGYLFSTRAWKSAYLEFRWVEKIDLPFTLKDVRLSSPAPRR